MSEIHDVLHTLIDVACGVQAHLSVNEAHLLHVGVDKALNDSTALDGPDTSPEPSPAQPANFPANPPYAEPYAPPAVSNAGEPVA
jgi:hypothetical protein